MHKSLNQFCTEDNSLQFTVWQWSRLRLSLPLGEGIGCSLGGLRFLFPSPFSRQSSASSLSSLGRATTFVLVSMSTFRRLRGRVDRKHCIAWEHRRVLSRPRWLPSVPVSQSRHPRSTRTREDVPWLRIAGTGINQVHDIRSTRAEDSIHAPGDHPIPRFLSISQWGAPQQALGVHLLVVYFSDKSCQKPHTTVRCYENTNAVSSYSTTASDLGKNISVPKKPIRATYVALVDRHTIFCHSLKSTTRQFTHVSCSPEIFSHYWLGLRGAWWMHCGLDRSDVHHPLALPPVHPSVTPPPPT